MISFPTDTHKQVFDKSIEYLKTIPEVGAVTLGGSLARSKGDFHSDIDINLYMKPEFEEDDSRKENIIKDFKNFETSLGKFDNVDKYFHVGIDIRALSVKPEPRDWVTGPDEYEVEIGNAYVYCELIYEHDLLFSNTKDNYLPYYSEDLRKERLDEVMMYLKNDIGKSEVAAERGLYFHAFKRFHNANLEFLQALFMVKKTYPLTYDKWVKEQLVDILKLPELYKDFVSLYELNELESNELLEKIKLLNSLIAKYIV